MTESQGEGAVDAETLDQDAGPASTPTGAAAEESPSAEEEDQDAGPASRPDVAPERG